MYIGHSKHSSLMHTEGNFFKMYQFYMILTITPIKDLILFLRMFTDLTIIVLKISNKFLQKSMWS